MEAHDTLSFPHIANVTADEVVMFSWVVSESKEARDAANAKIFNDPRIKEMMNESNPIFDCKRMAYGGFRQLVHA